MISPAHPPSVPWAPSPSPTQPPFSDVISAPPHQSLTPLHQTPSKQPIDFSPPLIAMVVIAAAAFLIVTYSRLISRHFLPPILRQLRRYRRWRRRRRRRLPSSGSATDSPPYTASDLGVYGLDESVIKSMPLSIFSLSHNKNNNFKGDDDDEFSLDCAVCLVEFVENEYVRTLPLCTHSFHVDCIDVWLRSHATCPLCRAGILPRDWPFIPVMAARIRPSFEELDTLFPDPQPQSRTESVAESVSEIVEAPIESEARPPQSMMLKRSYSFGFERNFASERLTATASPWRRGSFSFWRRPSPFSSIIKHRVFSFRSTRGMKSPLFGRRRTGRSKSPIFGTAPFSSSRMRCGDPEALISPERYAAARGAVD